MEHNAPFPPFEGDNRGSVLLTIEIVTLIIALCLIGMRIWTRTKIAGNLGWDDLFVITGMVRTHHRQQAIANTPLRFVLPRQQLPLSKHCKPVWEDMYTISDQSNWCRSRFGNISLYISSLRLRSSFDSL